MKEKESKRVAKLKDKISDTHDMQPVGTVWAWEGCGVSGSDVCAICGLRKNWGSGGQNTGSYTEFVTFDGTPLSLAAAARYPCD